MSLSLSLRNFKNTRTHTLIIILTIIGLIKNSLNLLSYAVWDEISFIMGTFA